MSEPAACPPPRTVYVCREECGPIEVWPLGSFTGRIEHDMGGVMLPPSQRAQTENPPLYEVPAVPLPASIFLLLAALGALALWRMRK